MLRFLILGIIISAACLPVRIWGETAIITPPEHTVVQVGEDTILYCETSTEDVRLEWYRVGQSGSQTLIYHAGGDVSNPSKYEIVEPLYSLRIKDATLGDAGPYKCREYGKTGFEVQLVVVEKPDTPFTVGSQGPLQDGSKTWLGCATGYSASSSLAELRPQLTALIDDVAQDTDTQVTGPSVEEPGQRSTISMTANYTARAQDDGKELECQISTDIPPFMLSSYSTLSIQYALTTVEITPHEVTFGVGDLLNCTTDGNPEASLTWTATSPPGLAAVGGDQLEVMPIMAGYNEWNCTAVQTGPFGTVTAVSSIGFTVAAGVSGGASSSLMWNRDAIVLSSSLFLWILKTKTFS